MAFILKSRCTAAPRQRLTLGRTAYALCAAAGSACQAGEAPVQEVQIVGIRASADAAAARKKERDEVSDSIVADDNDKIGGNLPLSNLSRTSANVVGIHDRGPLGIRVAWNWRDRYLSGVTQVVGVGAPPNYVQGYGWPDASLAWRIDQRTTLRLEGGDLLDTIRHSTWGSANRPQSTWQDGRQFGVALALKL